MMIEALEFVLHTLKFAVNPYPQLISEGWGYTEASMWMGFLYLTYCICFVALIEMYRGWKALEIKSDKRLNQKLDIEVLEEKLKEEDMRR